jgi:membrane-bound lytic murein transglycosylase A
MIVKNLGLISVGALFLSACATTPISAPPKPVEPAPAVVVPPVVIPTPVSPPAPVPPVVVPAPTVPSSAVPPAPADLVKLMFASAGFAELPDWSAIDLSAARRAMVRSCASLQRRPANSLLSTVATYSGRISDWSEVCAQASNGSLDDRSYWELNFQPWFVSTETTSIGRLTGYYEPILRASWQKDDVFSEPIQGKPSDLVEIDLGAFDQSLRNRSVIARIEDGRILPYRPRAEINAFNAPVLAWGEPAEVLSLQVQGSGRLQFTDGTQMRAAFVAHNGQKFGSNAQELIRRGHLPPNGASLDALKAWFKTASPQEAREVLNANPRTVFFKLEPIADPALGPRGGQSLPLEANGSMAVDTNYHAYGVQFQQIRPYDG